MSLGPLFSIISSIVLYNFKNFTYICTMKQGVIQKEFDISSAFSVILFFFIGTAIWLFGAIVETLLIFSDSIRGSEYGSNTLKNLFFLAVGKNRLGRNISNNMEMDIHNINEFSQNPNENIVEVSQHLLSIGQGLTTELINLNEPQNLIENQGNNESDNLNSQVAQDSVISVDYNRNRENINETSMV